MRPTWPRCSLPESWTTSMNISRSPNRTDFDSFNAPARNMRGNAADLAALLAAGALDYIYEYQSVAESNGFRFIQRARAKHAGQCGRPGRAARCRRAGLHL